MLSSRMKSYPKIDYKIDKDTQRKVYPDKIHVEIKGDIIKGVTSK